MNTPIGYISVQSNVLYRHCELALHNVSKHIDNIRYVIVREETDRRNWWRRLFCMSSTHCADVLQDYEAERIGLNESFKYGCFKWVEFKTDIQNLLKFRVHPSLQAAPIVLDIGLYSKIIAWAEGIQDG